MAKTLAHKPIWPSKIYSWDEVPALMRTDEVAVMLRIPEDTVRKYCETDQLPAKKIGKFWIVDKQLLMKQFGYTI